MKILLIWCAIFLHSTFVLSIGHTKPSGTLKRTVIDLTADDEHDSHHPIKHRHNKHLTIAKNLTLTERKQAINTAKSNSVEGFMVAWMKNNAVNYEKKDKEPVYKKAKNLGLSPPKTERGKKKQYSTDDFRVNSMSDEPMMSFDSSPPIMAPVPNHVQIDNIDEGIHMLGPPPMEHHEEQHHEEPHVYHYDPPPYIEEPTYVHHVEPPPPPPPEPVMIPVPIAAPAPPPPPPPPCTVHIPVTIHVKGELAIKMRHCENCDFSKNIEAIGPLKIAPINGLKAKTKTLIESQAMKAITKATAPDNVEDSSDDSVKGSKRNRPQISSSLDILFSQRPIADLGEVMAKSEAITFDDDFSVKDHFEGNDVVGSKKDVTAIPSNVKQLIVSKTISLPQSFLPDAAFKRGVIISLPKGKALLKCFAPVNDTKDKDDDSSTSFLTGIEKENEQFSSKENKEVGNKKVITPIQKQSNEATLPASNDIVTFSAPPYESRVIKPVSSLMPSPSLNVAPQPSDKKGTPITLSSTNDDLTTTDDHKTHKLTEKFLRMFDKDMLISLYKMAVKDILNELQRQKKAHKRTNALGRRMRILESERTSLESKYPGISNSLSPLHNLSTSTVSRQTRSISLESKSAKRIKIKSSKGLDKKNNIAGDIDDVEDEESVTYPNSHGEPVTVNLKKDHTFNGTRRVKLVDTYRPVKQTLKKQPERHRKLVKQGLNSLKMFHNQQRNTSQQLLRQATPPEIASSALSFYGDLDPLKLMDDTPQCIDPMCEKHKQFIKHAGQYFKSLDSIALEPYKAFMNDKVKAFPLKQDSNVYEEPFGGSVNIQTTQWDGTKSTKRQTILDTVDGVRSSSADEPSTIVELFGKLPRVPLKITLNPKGPLARMKKPIEIDLRPPGKGDPSSKMIATANDPTVAVHVANKIFKEEPLDPKQEQKLQQVYADIKKRSIAVSRPSTHLYLTPEKIISETKRTKIIVRIPKKVDYLEKIQTLKQPQVELKRKRISTKQKEKSRSEAANRRMKIIVSLPKELTKLVAQSNYQSFSRKSSPLSSSSILKLSSYPSPASLESKTSSPINRENDLNILSEQKPTYVVGEENENRLMGKEKSMLRPEIEEYEKKLQKLKEQTNAVMAQYNKLKDPYSDIGKKRRINHQSKKHHNQPKQEKYDPYADMGSNVAFMKRKSDIVKTETNSEDDTAVETLKNLLGVNSLNVKQDQIEDERTSAASTLLNHDGNDTEKAPSEVGLRENSNPESHFHNEKLPSIDAEADEQKNRSSKESTSSNEPKSTTTIENQEKQTGYGEKQDTDRSEHKGQIQTNAHEDATVKTDKGEESGDKSTQESDVKASTNPKENVIRKETSDSDKNDGHAINLHETEKTNSNNSEHLKVEMPKVVKKPLKSNLSDYEILAQDPYATLGSSVSMLVKRERFPKRKKRLERKQHGKQRKHAVRTAVNTAKRNLARNHAKQEVPSQSAISLIRHEPNDISKEVTMEPSIHSANNASVPGENPVDNHAKIEDTPSLKIDTNKALGDDEKTSIMKAFPKFSEALSKINPETRKKLLNLQPFKFLNKFETNNVPYNPTGKDPYADMGSEAPSSKRKVVYRKNSKKHSVTATTKKNNNKIKTEKGSKRSETPYDPYADLGTSIGLTQNEARNHDNETQTVKVSEASPDNGTQKTEDHEGDASMHQKNYLIQKQSKTLPPSTRSDQVESFTGAASSHVNALDTIDPYADVGASANRETSKQTKPQDLEETKNLKQDLDNNTKNDEHALSTNLQHDIPITPTPISDNVMVHKVQKTIDNDVEHFVGKLKLPDRLRGDRRVTASSRDHTANNEMETGDMNEPNNIMDRLANIEKEIAGENQLAIIEKLEKEIAAEKGKAEALTFPKSNSLQQNVGKEIEGPYTDMGTKKEKTLPSHGNNSIQMKQRKLRNEIASKTLHSRSNNSIQMKHQKIRNEIASKKSQPFRDTYNEKKMDIIKRLEAEVRELKSKRHTKCLPLKPHEIRKLIQHMGSVSANNPYFSIGSEVSEDTSKKHLINPCKFPVINEEETSVSTHTKKPTDSFILRGKNSKNKSAQSSTASTDPYAEMGTTVRMGEKKKEIALKTHSHTIEIDDKKGVTQKTVDEVESSGEKNKKVTEHYDPYEDLGTVSVK